MLDEVLPQAFFKEGGLLCILLGAFCQAACFCLSYFRAKFELADECSIVVEFLPLTCTCIQPFIYKASGSVDISAQLLQLCLQC